MPGLGTSPTPRAFPGAGCVWDLGHTQMELRHRDRHIGGLDTRVSASRANRVSRGAIR